VDPDEPPRVEFEPNHTAIIIKYPKNYSADDNFLFKVKSMGIFLFSDRVVLVASDSVQMFTGKIGINVYTVQDVLLKVLLQAVRHFESHLRVINMCSEELEGEVNDAVENRSLLNMFTLEKGLVYYVNALSGNGRVIERIKVNASKIGLTADNIELLDDLAIENSQSLDQAQVYSQVLSGLMDARASIISNNLNVMMKNLNAIVRAVAVPTFFTGVGGMSEFTSAVGEAHKYWAYPVFTLLMLGLGYLTFRFVEKYERH
jgi:magnesium transporter